MVKSNKTLTFKVVMVGNSGVGKTSLVNRIVNGTFNEQEAPTIGSQYVSVERTVENQQITLELWDTAGQEAYRSIVGFYSRDSKGAFLLFDVTNKETFQTLSKWIDFMNESAPEAKIFLFGNKNDLDNREVTEEQINNFAESNGLEWFEGSAKTGQNLEELIVNMCEKMYECFGPENKKNTVELNSNKKGKCMI